MRRGRAVRAVVLGLLLAAAGYAAAGLLAPDAVLRAALALDAWRSGAERSELQVGDHRWVLLSRGQARGSRGALVLVHGFTGSKENWLNLLRALPGDRPVLMPDLPGWGESERRSEADYGYVAQAGRVAALIEAMDLREAVLIGHSMGGGIAALSAARSPQRLQGVVLMSAAGVRYRDNDFGRAVLRGEHPFKAESAEELQRYLQLVFKQPPPLPWPLDAALLERRRSDLAFEQSVLQAIARGEQAFLPGEKAGAIRLPVLLLGCTADPVIDPSAADAYAARIPQARFAWIEDCAHMPMMEQPAATAQALHDFMETLP